MFFYLIFNYRIYRFIYLSIYIYIYIYISIYLFIHLSIYLLLSIYMYLSIYLSIYPSIYLYLPVLGSRPVLILTFPRLGLDLGLELCTKSVGLSFLCLVLISAHLVSNPTLVSTHLSIDLFFYLSIYLSRYM